MNKVTPRLLDWTEQGVETVLKHHPDAKFVMESPLKNIHGGWTLNTYMIFWTPEAHPQGSNYFAIGLNHHGVFIITNGVSATEPFDGILFDDGTVAYSIQRHDFYSVPNKGLAIDGGRDYVRLVGTRDKTSPHKLIKLQIKGAYLTYE